MPNHKQQTTVQERTAIKWGSCKMEVGATVGALVNVGAIRDVVWEETFDKVTVMSDNAGPIELGIRNHLCAISGNWMEINWDNLEKVYSGVHTVVAADDTPIVITDESHVLDDYDSEALTYKNGDNSEVASLSVDNLATATTTYVRDCDYIVVTLPNGQTAIARAEATSIETESELIAVTDTSKFFLSGGAWDAIPAIGDHITVSGFSGDNIANNGVKTVTAAVAGTITVSETLVDCAQGTGEGDAGTITILKGGIADGGTVFVNYTYTPLASRTYTGGGFGTFTPQVVRITNSDASTPAKTLRCTIFSATPDGGIKIDFPSDDDVDMALVPIKMNGRLDVDKTSGEQLFEIVDTQQTA